MTQPYVPLRVFSSFTMLEGAMEPKTIAERAAKLGFPAVAITDRNGLYGVMPFSDACIAKGVQPIIGAMLGVARPPDIGGEARRSTGWCCWPRTIKATPISASWFRRRISTARSSRSRMSPSRKLEGLNEGLIALTAGGEGALARLLADGQQHKAEAYLDRLQALFPGAALHRAQPPRRRGRGSRRKTALIDLAYARDLPLVATNPAAYADPVLPCGARCDAVHRQFGLCRKRRARHAPRRTPG